MTANKQWAFGDKVIHSAKPEWGTGVVTAAQGTTHEGQACQSLTVRFDRAGVKTLSTAFAKLVVAGEAPVLLAAAAAAAAREPATPVAGFRTGNGMGAVGGVAATGEPEATTDDAAFEAMTPKDFKQVMNRLPDAATDPFSTPLSRFKATINLYKFTPTGSSLLDWAAIQSGLADPMSKFNRHELERFFEGFVMARDSHTKKLIQELKKSDPAGLNQAMAGAPPVVQQTIRRLDAMR